MKIKYFEVDFRPIQNEVFLQVEHFGKNYDRNSSKSYRKIVSNEPLEFIPDLNTITLSKNVILTDNLSQGYISTMGLLISEKLKILVENLNLQSCEYYPAKVFHQKKVYSYYWLHFSTQIDHTIDFKASSFQIKSKRKAFETVRFKNYNDYNEKIESWIEKDFIDVSISELKMNNIIFNSDLFFLSLVGYKLYASQKFYDMVLENNISGFDFKTKPVVLIN